MEPGNFDGPGDFPVFEPTAIWHYTGVKDSSRNAFLDVVVRLCGSWLPGEIRGCLVQPTESAGLQMHETIALHYEDPLAHFFSVDWYSPLIVVVLLREMGDDILREVSAPPSAPESLGNSEHEGDEPPQGSTVGGEGEAGEDGGEGAAGEEGGARGVGAPGEGAPDGESADCQEDAAAAAESMSLGDTAGAGDLAGVEDTAGAGDSVGVAAGLTNNRTTPPATPANANPGPSPVKKIFQTMSSWLG